MMDRKKCHGHECQPLRIGREPHVLHVGVVFPAKDSLTEPIPLHVGFEFRDFPSRRPVATEGPSPGIEEK